MWAIEEGISTTQLLGYLLYLENYHEGAGRKISAVGWKMFLGGEISEKKSVSLEEALWMIEIDSLSQAVYSEIRLRFLNRFILPAVMHVSNESKRHRPSITEYHHRVKAPLCECLCLTLSERLQVIDLSRLDPVLQVRFKFTWGLDGSGQHSNYHQLSKTHFSTSQIMSVCLALKEFTVEDTSGVQISWNSSDKGANKPQNVQPLALIPAKEEKELLLEFIPGVEEEIKKLNEEGVEIKVRDLSVRARCDYSSLSMADGKMVTTLLQLGGAYCTICSKSQVQCHDPDIISGGFLIERSVESLRDIALSLTDPDTGDIIRKKGVYTQRQGVCDVPITESDLTRNIPVCHSKIRTFEWIIELITWELSHKK